MARAVDVAIIASGGGHTGHGYVVAEALREKGVEMAFIIPRGDAFSRSKLTGLGEIYEVLKPVEPGQGYLANTHRFAAAAVETLRLGLRPRIVVATGSNHSLAPSIIYRLRGSLLVLIESPVRIATPAKTVKLLYPMAYTVLLSWPEQKRMYPRGIHVGPLYEKPRHPIRDEGYVFVTTGTAGYPGLVERIMELPIEKAVVQTGRDDPARYRARRPDWVFFSYDPDIGRWLSGASVVVSHFGRVVLEAALTYRKPVVIVMDEPEKIRHAATPQDAIELARRLNAILLPHTASPGEIMWAIEAARKRRPPHYPYGAARAAEAIVRLLDSIKREG